MYFKGFRARILACLIAFVLIVSTIAPVMASSDSLEDLANYALVKQHEIYDGEKESEWDKIEPYDAYILSKAGVDVEKWARKNTNLKEETLKNIGKLDEGDSIKHIAGGYLLARHLGENEKAASLLGIIKEMQKPEGKFGENEYSIYSDAPAIEYLGRAVALDEIDVVGAVYAITNFQDDLTSTSQAIRGLHYLEKVTEGNGLKSKITESVNLGLIWLGDLQRNDGSYIYVEEWEDPQINTAEILMTIKTLGLEGSNEWQDKFNDGLTYILNNSPNPDGKIGMGTVANYTAILDLAMALNDGYEAPETFIYLNSPKFEINKGNTKELQVNKFNKVGTKEGIGDNLTWDSDNPSIATVSNTGLVTGISTGTATITATYGDLVAQGTVKVLGSSGGGTVPSDKQGTAYVTIRGDSETGTILSSTAYIWTDKEVSVLHMLEKVLQGQGISYTATGGYVSEIAGLAHQKPSYPLSGWKFKVNGIDADKGAGDFTLKDGDRVEWYYSLDYTKDEDSKEFNIDKKKLEKEKEILTAAERWLEVHYVHILLKWWILFLG